MPVYCPAPESPLIHDSNSWKEEGTVGEDSSHAVPGSFLGREDLPSFSPACVLQEEKSLSNPDSLGEGLTRQGGVLGTLKDST